MRHPLLASGRDADVYALDDHRVLRRYRGGGDVAAEAAVMRHLGRHGFPVPEVYEASGTDLVMERVDGPTMSQAFLAGQTGPATGAGLLADLHTRLHALPPRGSRDPADRILHLDLHPDNVILAARGPVLIDWRDATEGPPDLDLALTALIIGEIIAGSYAPADLAPAAQELLAAFLDRAGGDPLTQLGQAVARRTANPNLSPAEKARLAQAATRVRVTWQSLRPSSA
jgi:aminoglycoside phosphotransferase (APT) family kinase protein